ncbi:MAG TPA: GNAT family N-acetyltransferase [Syntrophomonadaceae bacterium]|nr:GNAT family N-acetyltransferase [Syntrophomonadaceae bacterium]
MIEVCFAGKKDLDTLQDILWENEMGLAGDIEEHVVLKKNEKIVAGAKIAYLGDDFFHLEVIGVKNELQGKGYGKILIEKIIHNPWYYSLYESQKENHFKITTVSKGTKKGFYQQRGFMPCDFTELLYPYNEQCCECPEMAECNPVPMILKWDSKE